MAFYYRNGLWLVSYTITLSREGTGVGGDCSGSTPLKEHIRCIRGAFGTLP
jgi:hypothetical protein